MSEIDAMHPDKRISIEETMAVINALPRNKAAGPDGLRAEFFKANAHQWAKVITNVVIAFRHSSTSIPNCLTKSIIVLLYKNGPPTKVGNYRPIALVNVATKIVSAIYCNRLKPILSYIIPATQKDFVSRHTIIKNIIMTQNIM